MADDVFDGIVYLTDGALYTAFTGSSEVVTELGETGSEPREKYLCPVVWWILPSICVAFYLAYQELSGASTAHVEPFRAPCFVDLLGDPLLGIVPRY